MMAENNDSQVDPLAPSKIYGRSDEYPPAPSKIYGQSDEAFAIWRPKREKKSSKCLVYFLILVLIVSVLIFIFANVVLRIEAPQVTLNSVSIKRFTNLTGSTTASLNASLITEIDIDNNNFGYYEFEDSSVSVLCENVTVGIGKINGGRVAARSAEKMNVTVEVTSNQALRESNFTNEFNSGILELRSYAKVVGRIHIRKMLNRRRSHLMNCTMALNLTSKSIQDLICL